MVYVTRHSENAIERTSDAAYLIESLPPFDLSCCWFFGYDDLLAAAPLSYSSNRIAYCLRLVIEWSCSVSNSPHDCALLTLGFHSFVALT